MSDHKGSSSAPGGRIEDMLKSAPEREREGVGDYVSSMNETELKVLQIAMDSLGSSFDLAKSSGYLRWKSRKA